MNPHKGRTGLSRVLHATRYSWHGLSAAYREEAAFRQEAWLAVAALPCALWLARSPLEAVLLMAAVLLVLIVELLNSGIEAAIDRISLDHHPLAKRAKDYGSAAVMLALVVCAALWAAVVWQRVVPT